MTDPGTTDALTSAALAEQAAGLELSRFTTADAVVLGELASARAQADALPIVVEVWHLGRLAFRVALPGSARESDGWIQRKRRVVERFETATLAMRIKYEERGTTFAAATGLSEAEYAAHGGGVPIVVAGVGVVGAMYVSGLPDVDDHGLIVACLRELAARP